MRYFLALIMIFIVSCGGGGNGGNKSTHCYLYAAQYLCIGNIPEAFDSAAQLKRHYPPTGSINEILNEKDNLASHHIILCPERPDLWECENRLCAFEDYGKGHAMIYIFEDDMLYDNAKCRNGCVNNMDFSRETVLHVTTLITD